MKNLLVQKSVFAVLLVAAVAAHAQGTYYPPTICGRGFDDSTCGNGAGRGTPQIPLKYQERETPVVNNVTNTTNQITQVVQPNITTSSGSGDGIRFANAYAGCGSAVMVGGGGTCEAADGYASMPTSQPNGNGWQVVCDAFNGGYVIARVWATCSN